MKVLAWIVLVVSLLIGLGAISMDTSVGTMAGGRVHNIGLMQTQQNMLMLAMFGVIVAIILFVIGRQKPQPATAPAPYVETRQCPFCAEEIRVEAIRCKHCGADVPEKTASKKRFEIAEPSAEDIQMQKHGITFDRGMYRLNGIGYDSLQAAIADSKKH